MTVLEVTNILLDHIYIHRIQVKYFDCRIQSQYKSKVDATFLTGTKFDFTHDFYLQFELKFELPFILQFRLG